MGNSVVLSKSAAGIGGGRGIFNDDALYHEVGLRKAIPKLISILEKEYPNVDFFHQKKITQKQIIEKVSLIDNVPVEELYVPVSEDSFVSPDGGIVYAVIDGKEYPILISEAKKQGTPLFKKDGTIIEGLTERQMKLALKGGKQDRGNAIERAYKNVDEFRLYCEDLNYFPYILFACGKDFEMTSTIRDRCSALTRKRIYNVNYVTDLPQKVTLYLQEDYFTANEMFERIYEVATISLECIGV